MKKVIKGLAACLFAVFAFSMFAGTAKASAVTITELNITSPLTEVYAGTLLSFGASTATEHVSVEDYGSNTIWVYWPENGDSWHAFGGETPTAVDDGVTRYGVRLKLDTDEDYEIAESPSVIFNTANITESQYTVFNKYDWGGYLFIDLGLVSHTDQTEQTFNLTFDFNGGATFDGQGVVVKENMVSFAPALNDAFLVSCFAEDLETHDCYPIEIVKGKVLDYVTVNGERYEVNVDDGFMFNQDTTIVYYWTDMDLEEYEASDGQGNSVVFEEEEGHEYTFEVKKYSFTMTDEELEAAEITPEDYEAGKAAVMALTNEYGETIAFFEFEIYDENGRYIHQGPFEISIPFTDDMAGYELYQLVYVNMDDEENPYVEEPINLTLVDGFLVGSVPHFSGFALVGGDAPKAPDTGVLTTTAKSATILPMGFCFCYLFAFVIGFIVVMKSEINKQ